MVFSELKAIFDILIKVLKLRGVYFSIIFVISSGLGTILSGMFDPVPDGFYSFGNRLHGFIWGVTSGVLFGLIAYWILSLLPIIVFYIVSIKTRFWFSLIYIPITIFLGIISGMFFFQKPSNLNILPPNTHKAKPKL